MRRHLLAGFLSVIAACGQNGVRHSSGPLLALVDRRPSANGCQVEHTEYARPFWRAPYQRCGDSLPDGYQAVVVDADSVVVEAYRAWVIQPRTQKANWDREAGRITRLFGEPVRRLGRPEASLPPYCAAWRGPDSVEVALRLQPISDVGPVSIDEQWQLHRDARYGPLPDVVACGLR